MTRRFLLLLFFLVNGSIIVNAENLTFSKQQQDYLQQKQVIKACVDPDWMPIEKFEDGEYSGIGADYLKILQQKIETPIQVLPTKDWSESLVKAKIRECDIFLISMAVAPQQSFMNVTSPYLTLPVVLATKRDVMYVSQLSEIVDKKLGLLEGCDLAKTIKDANPNIEFIMAPSRQDGLQMVSNNEIFGFIENLYSLGHEIQKNYYGELKIGGNLGIEWNMGVATRNDDPMLYQIFQQAALSVTEHDKRNILNRWTAIEYVEDFNYQLLWQVVFGFVLLLMTFFFRHHQVVTHKAEITLKNNELAKINQELQSQKSEVQHHADHDFLTQLPNRKKVNELLLHAIEIAKRQQHKVAVLFLDLDEFKNINDTFGHSVGDQILMKTAERLKKRLRASDSVARIGGDEFLIILEDVKDTQMVDIIANTILNEIQKPIQIQDNQHINSTSIGIAFFPDDGEKATTLINHADKAMYHAKQQGKNTYQYYKKADIG